MIRGMLAAGWLMVAGLGTITVLLAPVAGADPVVTPFGPGAPIPNPIVAPWEGGGASLFAPNSEFSPQLQGSDGAARQGSGGAFGMLCNNQGADCPWGS